MSGAAREIAEVARHELKAMLGARLALFVCGYGAVATAAGAAYRKIAAGVSEQLDAAAANGGGVDTKAAALEQLGSAEVREQLQEPLQWLGAESLFDAIVAGALPWSLAFVLVFSSFAVGGLTFVVSHDRIAADLHTRFTRYLLLRVRRSSYLLGKLLGQWAGLMVGLALVQLVLLGMSTQDPLLDAAGVARALPGVWAMNALLVLAYLCFSAALSATLGRPFAVLAGGGALLCGLWFTSIFTFVRRVWMGNFDMGLWVYDPVAIGVFLAHALVFAGLAFLSLSRRDV